MIGGMALSAKRSPIASWTIIPATLLFLGLICTQNIIWSRWALPVMPMICIFAGLAIATLGELIGRRLSGTRSAIAIGVLAVVAGAPSLKALIAHKTERAHDTRIQAARWSTAHIPPGSTVVFEHLELKLRDQPWTILFPIGDAGCIDGKRALTDGVKYDEVEQLRNGSPIVDLGNVNPKRINTCRADYAVLAYYDLYLAERTRYPDELETYRRLLAGGRTVGLFRPQPGLSGGPVVRIVALPPH